MTEPQAALGNRDTVGSSSPRLDSSDEQAEGVDDPFDQIDDQLRDDESVVFQRPESEAILSEASSSQHYLSWSEFQCAPVSFERTGDDEFEGFLTGPERTTGGTRYRKRYGITIVEGRLVVQLDGDEQVFAKGSWKNAETGGVGCFEGEYVVGVYSGLKGRELGFHLLPASVALGCEREPCDECLVGYQVFLKERGAFHTPQTWRDPLVSVGAWVQKCGRALSPNVRSAEERLRPVDVWKLAPESTGTLYSDPRSCAEARQLGGGEHTQ